MIRKIALLILIALSLGSCVPSKKIVYFQGISDTKADSTGNANGNASNYETKLKSDDLLIIIVSAPDPMAALPFNLPVIAVPNKSLDMATASGTQQLQTYLIDNQGNIQFPIIGSIKMAGLTKAQALAQLITKLKKYINDPIVNLRISNYKVSVMGEVLHPGTFAIVSERITLPDALSMAGDMTIYGSREQVLILRDINGVKTHTYVDINSSDFINSPFYYLTQNDVVYVKPNKTKINSSVIGPNTTVIISSISLLITVIALLTR